MGSVIVVGSINVDLIVRVPRLPAGGETVIGGELLRQGGGKSANQAVAAARVGAAARLIGPVGDDDLGRAALAGLTDAGVDTRACVTIDGVSTGVALIVVDAAGENQIAVAAGANGVLGGADVQARLEGLDPAPGTVCLLGLEVGDEPLAAAARWAVVHGLPIVLNPAPARALPASLIECGPILTPNRSEVRLISGEADVEAGARALAARSGAPVIVTLGREGAILLRDGDVTEVAALPVRAVDSTGAGDTLNGILAAELARGADLDDALRWAVAGASLSTATPGAQAGAPTREAIAARIG